MGALVEWTLKIRHETWFRFRGKVWKTWKRLDIMMHKFFIRLELLSHHTQKKHPTSGIRNIIYEIYNWNCSLYSLNMHMHKARNCFTFSKQQPTQLSMLQQCWLWIISKYSRIYSWLVNILICKLNPATSCPW